MKKTLLAVTLAALTSGAATTALAADPKAPEPDFEISGNFGLVSDYKFRGISQTNGKPAAQGGFDFAHKSGAYAGIWTSNISSWTAAGSSQEIDLYGGFSGSTGSLEYDIGYIAYQYPGNTNALKNNSQEIYVGVTYGPLSYKVSRTLSNYFGIAENTDGSMYHDLSVSHQVSEKLSLTAHAGMQKIKNNTTDFKDYSVGGSYDLEDGYSIGLTFHSTDFDNHASRDTWVGPASNTANAKLYESKAVISLSKTF
jgi:uncharacterized protein (TIGR02001 family)